MPRSDTLLNDKDNVMRRNRRHLLKMDSNFVETENGTDMENDIEAEPKTKHSMSETEPEEEEI